MAKKQSFVGIDLGGSSIKVVELTNANGRPQLVTYGFIDESYNIVKDDSKEARQAIGSHLKELLKQSKVSSDSAVSALPSFSVFSSIISLPAMNKKDLISAVRWEAKKFVPIPLEEMILDWEVLEDTSTPSSDEKSKSGKKGDDESSKKDESKDKKDSEVKDSKKDKPKKKVRVGEELKGNIKVLLTAAPKNLVNNYVELFKDVGLRLVGLETESFAIERSLIGNDRNPIMVIDIGSKVTSIIIFSDGVPILNRSIDMGGKTITKALVEIMGLTEDQAEQFKRDMGVKVATDTLEDLPKPIKDAITQIMNEIRYILNIYKNQNKKPISKIVVTGGSAFLGNLTNYIQQSFNINSFVGDPWARVVHPVEIDSLLKQLGPRFSVAIGLAMREIS